MKYEAPENPGIYMMKDSSGEIIYIGKAKNLRKRVSSYFQKKDHDPKTEALVANIDSIDFIATNTEVEALILENNLIKKHKPKYNIDLRDSKRYAYIMITKDRYPRLKIARQKTENGDYFGPFVSAEKRDMIMKFANNLFRLCTAKKMNNKKPCFRYHMGYCSGACIGEITEEDYRNTIEDVKAFLSGNNAELIRDLTSRMKKLASEQEFEHAKILRDQIEALKALEERQNMELSRKYDEDIINYVIIESTVHLTVFNVYKGVLSAKNEFDFPYREDFLEEFIVQFYSDHPVPKELIVPAPVDASVAEYLSVKREGKVNMIVPQKGAKKQLLDLVKKNIELEYIGDEEKLILLKEALGLSKLPKVIECFDISHLSGTETVGSMVQFRNAKPDKSNYRRFRIRTVHGIDDFAAIGEVVSRRYYRIIKENSEFPDLIIIDGGKGQLSSAVKILKRLKVDVPIISIAKQFEEIYLPDKDEPLRLSRKEKPLQLVQRIRDEAHRFAINYNRLLRSKKIKK